VDYDPHCLSRVFNEDWYAHYLNPEAMEKTMSSNTYNEFFQALELEQHDIIPLGIQGDFVSFTAPNGTAFSTYS
jgi:tyrosinase